MSSPVYDCGQAHRELGECLNHFLYQDGKPKNNIKNEHTYGELWNELESIRKDAWESYSDIADYMGWE